MLSEPPSAPPSLLPFAAVANYCSFSNVRCVIQRSSRHIVVSFPSQMVFASPISSIDVQSSIGWYARIERNLRPTQTHKRRWETESGRCKFRLKCCAEIQLCRQCVGHTAHSMSALHRQQTFRQMTACSMLLLSERSNSVVFCLQNFCNFGVSIEYSPHLCISAWVLYTL